ncbi:Serine-threonine/tyrosine-protein kinase, catalytic domain [Dillenia turbinata]|uniref:Serine-threonine/tyrosine-protein kinase, catalytic domain n=1 Tax=Dillenia turbinata TaxID=194707 RepID=A0AAN8W6N8_9MAGN
MVDQRSAIVVTLVSLLFLLLFDSTLEQQLTSYSEKQALLQLRSTLGIRSKDWPKKADPCLNWTGISCQNGSVIGINISGFRRTRVGSQNPSFSVDALVNLTNLMSFNASNFLLPGQIPDLFGDKLLLLQGLDLRSCSVVGPIPLSLGNASNLISLYLSNNSITGLIPSSLGQLSKLLYLDLSQNSLTGSITLEFSSLGNLSLLDLSSNFLSGSIPPGIGALPKLQVLNLSNNSFTSSIPAQLGDLGSLVELDLGMNDLFGSLSLDLGGLRSLQKMLLGNNKLSGELPNDLFSSLTRLQYIDLSKNSFNGSIPNAIFSMSQLQFLDISGNNFTSQLPDLGSTTNSTGAVFNLSQNMFYGNLTSVLGRFSYVDLSGNYFEGKVPDYVPGNRSLDSNCLQNVSNQRTLEDCSSFYVARGLIFDGFGQQNDTAAPKSSGNSSRRWIILAGVLGGVAFIAILVFLIVIVIFCTRRRGTNQRSNGVGPIPAGGSPSPQGVAVDFSSLGEKFGHQRLLHATNNFNDVNLIKHGHSGDLYRGVLENGMLVVIKKINLHSVKKESYLQELDFFNKVSYTRVVPFLGHCLDNENEKFIVYKNMPNGDLDVQASSILLDDKFEVRLGSLSEICAQEGDAHQNVISKFLRLPQSSDQGSSGVPRNGRTAFVKTSCICSPWFPKVAVDQSFVNHISLEWPGSKTASCFYDVYCFGKVLLELVTGKMGISASNDATVRDWLDQTLPHININDKDSLTKIVDPSLILDEDFFEEVWAMAIVAKSCLNPKPSRRPLMRYVLKALENPLKVVREENSSSERLKATSSRGSWNAALFGSWRHSSSEVVATSTIRAEGTSSFKRSGTTGSQGSGQIGGDHSSSQRQQSREVFPEPSNGQDRERRDE